jgi:ABC-type cobalt transport system substrate-binding protein
MNKKAMEIQTLVIILLSVVFLIIMLSVAMILFTEGNPFSGADSLCNTTGIFRGCS